MAKNVRCGKVGCQKKLPQGRRKYCSDNCQSAQYMRNRRRGKEEVKPINAERDTAASARRGPLYEAFKKSELADQVAEGNIDQKDAAELLGTTSASISRLLAAYKEDQYTEGLQEDWSVSDEALENTKNFSTFRDMYFRTETGEKYETADFHVKWINNIVDAIEHGKELVILSPPRHGKTELLVHFAVWQIIRNPNIRIMWVGGNEDIAKNAVSAVLDHLDSNITLIEDFCGPGAGFKPDTRSGKNWSQNQFTVATRTVTGIKSPTMVAVGKGGKILSRDCDLIIADDIEDHSTTIQPSNREHTRSWWTTTLSSRKEEHTAIVVIGSRQHPDDLYHHLLGNDQYENIVETAHDLECTEAEEDIELHDDCMLWGSKRTYKWLKSRMAAAETTGGRNVFDMVYLNQAYSVGMTIFNLEDVENCYRSNLTIGHIPHQNLHLVAGLDPASSGHQAAFLWGYDIVKKEYYMIDNDNRKGGGTKAAFEVIKDWYEKYRVREWVIEENGFQTAIRQDEKIKRLALECGIVLTGTKTGLNKHDPMFGVGAMSELFEEGRVHLPVGDGISRDKTGAYKSQLVYFDGKPQNRRTKHKTDLVMASWFPMKVFRRMTKERSAMIGLDYEPSFADWDINDWNEAPWQ